MEKVRYGIVGVGTMGRTHAVKFLDGKVANSVLGAVCDIDPEKREWCKKNMPEIPCFDTAEEMFASGTCDAVVIAIPHYDHPGYAIKALEAGLHVMTEKPAGVYTKQVLEMNEAAKKSGKVFGIMFNQRSYGAHQKLRDLIQKGELGKIKRAVWVVDWYRPQAYHDSATWRSTWATEGGGLLINQDPHQIDLWQWLFGVPDRIMSHVGFGKYRDIEVEDEVIAYMEYKNGMNGVFISSSAQSPSVNRLEIFCDRGVVTLEGGKINFKRNVIGEEEFNKNNTAIFGSPEAWNCEVPVPKKEEGHTAIFADFTKSILTGSELLAPGYDGINETTISNAIHYSAWNDSIWVETAKFPHDEFYNMLQDKIKNSTVVKKENNASVDFTEFGRSQN